MNEIENIKFITTPLFNINATCIEEMLKIKNKTFFLPFNMNNCFGTYKMFPHPLLKHFIENHLVFVLLFG